MEFFGIFAMRGWPVAPFFAPPCISTAQQNRKLTNEVVIRTPWCACWTRVPIIRDHNRMLSVVLPWRKSLDVVVDQCNNDSLMTSPVEDIVTVQIAWVKPGVVWRCKLSTSLVLTSYVEQTRCSHTHTHTYTQAYTQFFLSFFFFFFFFFLSLLLFHSSRQWQQNKTKILWMKKDNGHIAPTTVQNTKKLRILEKLSKSYKCDTTFRYPLTYFLTYLLIYSFILLKWLLGQLLLLLLFNPWLKKYPKAE